MADCKCDCKADTMHWINSIIIGALTGIFVMCALMSSDTTDIREQVHQMQAKCQK